MPTVIGEHTEILDPNQQTASGDQQTEKKTYQFGNSAFNNKDTHTLYEPIKRGQICDRVNWDNMEKIWGHIFNELGVDPKNINLLMTDSPFAEK